MAGIKRSASEMEQSPTGPKLIIFASDALIDGRKAMDSTIHKLFAALKPTIPPPTRSAIRSAFSRGPRPLKDILLQLGATFDTANVSLWTTQYCELIAQEETPFYTDVKDLLSALTRHNIPVMVATNHTGTVLKLLKEAKIEDQVHAVMDHLLYFVANPAEFRHVFKQTVVPWVADIYRELDEKRGDGFEMHMEDVVVVSCSAKLLALGRTIGAQTCWVNKMGVAGDGDGEEGGGDDDRDADGAEIVVSTLAEVGVYLFGDEEEGEEGAVEILE